MVTQLGDFNTTETVNIPFNTFSSDDPCASVTVTNLAVGDIEIHKNGSVTQRASDNGVTVSIDFDGVVGNHMIHIVLSDNSDAGFYSNGARYAVRIEGVTVDGGTINAWIGCFSVGCTLRPTTAGRTLDVESGGCTGVDWANVANPTTAVDLSATDIQLADTVTTLTGHTKQTGDSFARLGAPAAASIAADLVVIDNFVDELESRLTAIRAGYIDNLSAGAVALATGVQLSAQGKLDVNAECDTALSDYGANTTTPPTVGAIRTEMEGVGTKLTGVKDKTDNLVFTTANKVDARMDYVGANAVTTPNDMKADVSNLDQSLSSTESNIRGADSDTLETLSDQIDNVPTVTEMNARTRPTADYFDQINDPVEIRATGGTAGKNAEELVDDNWDELLTGATHNIATSAGRRLREIAGIAIRVGTAQAGASNTITLDAGASAINSIYNRNIIAITGGTGEGQTRLVAEYYGATKIVLVDRVWYVNPDNTSEFQLLASPGYFCINCGLAQAGAAGSITLEAGASAIINAYRDCYIYLSSGTGAGQTRNITAYNAGTKVASVVPNWDVNPDNTSVYHVSAFARTNLGQIEGVDATDQIRDAVLDDATRIDGSALNTLSGHDPAGQLAAQSDITGLATEAKQDIIDTNVDSILVDTGTTIPAQITALNDITVADILAGVIEGTITVQQAHRILISALAGITTNNGTRFRDIADAKNRIVATLDVNKNRTNMVLDGS